MIENEKRRQEQIERDAVAFSLADFEQSDLETYSSFITPKEALARFPYDAELAVKQLQRELRHGRVTSICDEGSIYYNSNSYSVSLAVLHSWHWWQQMPRLQDDFWETGYLEIMIPEKVGGLTFKTCGSIRYFDVRFDSAKLPEAVKPPLSVVTSPVQARKLNKGGRPPKPWWDELWAHIGSQLYNGGLKPSKLADIESAMHDWLSERGETAGETPIRASAKHLWDAIQKED